MRLTTAIPVRLERDQVRELRRIADAESLPLSYVLRRAIREWLARRKVPKEVIR